jgi:hypothetical protein
LLFRLLVQAVVLLYSVSGILLASVFIVRETCLKYISGLPGGGHFNPPPGTQKETARGQKCQTVRQQSSWRK